MYRGRLINSSPVKISWTNARTCGNVSRGPCAGPPAFGLEKREGHGADHHVVLPAGIRAAFEVIEPEFGLEVLIVLFDRPALMRQPHELRQRGGRGQRHEVVLAASGRARRLVRTAARFLGRAVAAANRWPGVTRRAAKSASHGRIGPVAPRDAAPRARRQRVAEGADAERLLIGPAVADDCAAAVARDRRAASACRGRPSASARCPTHTAARSRCSVWRTVRLSPYSASATTAVRVRPAARVRRTSVRARRHFS